MKKYFGYAFKPLEYTVDYQQGDTVWFVIDTDEWENQGKIATLYCPTVMEQHDNRFRKSEAREQKTVNPSRDR